jgi:hypothetical protein
MSTLTAGGGVGPEALAAGAALAELAAEAEAAADAAVLVFVDPVAPAVVCAAATIE